MDRPSQYKQSSARGNVSVVANPKIDIVVNTGFTSSELRLPRSELGETASMECGRPRCTATRTGPVLASIIRSTRPDSTLAATCGRRRE